MRKNVLLKSQAKSRLRPQFLEKYIGIEEKGGIALREYTFLEQSLQGSFATASFLQTFYKPCKFEHLVKFEIWNV